MEEHRLRLNKKEEESSYRKLKDIVDRLTKQVDYYKNELELIDEEKGESEPIIE